MCNLLDVIEGNLRRVPNICTELLDFLPEGLEVWLLLVEQCLESPRGNAVATLGDGMGHPVVEL
jgi:hypothetical protein